MANLYEINAKLEYLCDLDTGELLTDEELDALKLEKDEKITNLCLWIKNMKAEENALTDEIKNMTARKAVLVNKQARLKEYIASVLGGEKWDGDERHRVKVQYHTSTSTKIDDISLIPAKYLKIADPEPKLTEIKKAINSGEEISGAHLETKKSVVSK